MGDLTLTESERNLIGRHKFIGTLETRWMTVTEGESLLASGNGWEYGGYGVGDSMQVFRFVKKPHKIHFWRRVLSRLHGG